MKSERLWLKNAMRYIETKTTFNLRKRIADSPRVNRAVENCIAAYIRFAYRTSRFDRYGFEALDACVARHEPVIMVLWHQRLAMAGYAFPVQLGSILSLTTSARAGRLAGQILRRFGFDNIAMASKQRHVKHSRHILKRMSAGESIGIAADGPGGPARVAKDVPLKWARASNARVFAVSFSANNVLRIPTWDRLMLPVPWSRGVIHCREWSEPVPRSATDAEMERLRLSLEETINAVTDDTDSAIKQFARKRSDKQSPAK